jgi:hypothetical protein
MAGSAVLSGIVEIESEWTATDREAKTCDGPARVPLHPEPALNLSKVSLQRTDGEPGAPGLVGHAEFLERVVEAKALL